jgi:Na+-driven multidrug efflux pump
MLRGLVGNNDMSHELMAAAQKYVWIRSLGMPAAAMIGTAQAACLGMQDVKSPLLVTLLAASVNLIVDVILVRNSHAWIGGTAGAAWATILSQYVAVTCYLQWLCDGSFIGHRLWTTVKGKFLELRNPLFDRKTSEVKPKSGSNSRLSNIAKALSEHTEEKRKSDGTSVRGILKGRFQLRDLFFRRHGEKSTSRDFAPYVIPVTTTQVGRCSVYVAMGVVVSGLNVKNMAANQILNAFFYALIPIADALSQTAQALLPPIFAASGTENEPKENVQLLQSALTSFLRAALLCGGALAGIVAFIPWLTKTWMTSDPTVQQIVNTVVPIHMLIFTLHGIFCASEGILLAQKDLGFLGRMYGLYFAVVPAIMLQLKRVGTQLELHTIWNVFLVYQLFRIAAWVGRVLWLFRKTKVASKCETTGYIPILATEK